MKTLETTEFIWLVIWVILSFYVAHKVNAPLLSAIALIVPVVCYIFSRALYKRSRAITPGERTTEFYVTAIVMLALPVIPGLRLDAAILLAGIVVGAYILARGYTKGISNRQTFIP